MLEVAQEEYWAYLAEHKVVSAGPSTIRLKGHQRPKVLQPEDFKTETTTSWSFEKRGSWATHSAGYRGNWAPQIARNIIERYSKPGDTVLDQMSGGGTTMVECVLTGRHGIGVDVNRDSVMLTWDRLNFDFSKAPSEQIPDIDSRITLYQGDARNLHGIDCNTIDLIATHPPYANIIRYSKSSAERLDGDLSNVRSIAQYVEEMGRVAAEAYRVLKPDHYCAVLMGDTRRSKHYVPIAYRVMDTFLEAGFLLKEDIIKAQWHTTTEGLWGRLSRDKNFLLIMHEHLFIFRKPAEGEDTRPFHESAAWKQS